MSVVYHVTNLTKIYKGSSTKANDGLTVDIQEGEIFGLLGPNGAGKSTLVNQLAGLVKPTSGTLHLYGHDVTARPDVIPEYVALQPQNTVALLDLRPAEAIYHTGRFRGMSPAAARAQTKALMAELGLEGLNRNVVRSLSGGQRKLVSLAVAFVGDRPLLIFDEPTNDLDPVLRRRVWDKILQLNQREGRTIILVTHNVLEAERVIQRVGIINRGQLIALGTPGELKAHVDQRVRLELVLRSEGEELSGFPTEFGEARVLAGHHWVLLCPRDQVRQAFGAVLDRVGLDQVDDFRILTPSLEDVYLRLGGGAKLA